MEYNLPLTIDNGHGESITFKEIIKEPDGDKLLLEGRVQSKCGPVMHVHYKQDEHFHVVQGTMVYETPGKEQAKLVKGQSTTFLRNTPHKFWNGGDEELLLSCWIKPANNAIYYLSALYNATKNQKKANPDPFVGAFLSVKYGSEYGIVELPGFVKKIIIPITYFFGMISGKYRKFKEAPEAVK